MTVESLQELARWKHHYTGGDRHTLADYTELDD